MQLQVNENGGRRNVARLDSARMDDVLRATKVLADVLQETHAWKILDADAADVWHFDERRRAREARNP